MYLSGYRIGEDIFILTCLSWGAWVAQLVKSLTLGFGSGHDLMVCESESHIGSMLTMQSLLGILSLLLSSPPPLTPSVSFFKINKLKHKKILKKTCLSFSNEH